MTLSTRPLLPVLALAGLIVLMASPAGAEPSGDARARLLAEIEALKADALVGDASALAGARMHVQRARQALTARPGDADRGPCIDEMAQRFGAWQVESQALQSAIGQCQQPIHMPAFRRLDTLFSKMYVAQTALERAAAGARLLGPHGERVPIFEFAFPIYRRVHVEQTAIDKALAVARQVPGHQLGCLQTVFNHQRRLTIEQTALDKAVGACSGQ